jgi:cyclopropane fatty-acyl-phospholipid synthase-like methyltransferase
MMKYYSFATIDYLILENLRFHRDLSVLEIGVGAGSTARRIIGNVKEFCGVDISEETIKQLNWVYKNHGTANFYVTDVCNNSYLGRKFDIVFSADTLEHVRSPIGFFHFIARHLSTDGVALVTFPNESERKHHGISWFSRKEDLLELIDYSGLEISNLCEVKKTFYHKSIEALLWRLPKSIAGRRRKISPQSFEDTQAFAIIKAGGLKMKFYATYASAVTKLAACFPLYHFHDIGNNVNDKVVLMHLKHKR